MVKSHKKEEIEFIKRASEEIPPAMDELLSKMLREGMTPQEATELSPNYLEGLYTQAYNLYNTGRYNEAAELFRTLILLNSLEFKYTLGFAACFHKLKDYENAIKTYTACTVLDPQDPLPYYHSSDCYLQQQDELSALICLKRSIQVAGNRPEFSNIKERALLSLKKLQTDLEEKGAFSDEFNQTTDSNQP